MLEVAPPPGLVTATPAEDHEQVRAEREACSPRPHLQEQRGAGGAKGETCGDSLLRAGAAAEAGEHLDNQVRQLSDDVRHGLMLIISYSGYNSTPSYDERSTPRYGSSGGRTPGGRTPGAGGRTPQDRRSGDKRTPRGHFGDATPLYDE